MNLTQELIKIDKNLDNIRNKLDIILIANVVSPRGYTNKKQKLDCHKNEKFTYEEFNEIYKGIINANLFIKSVIFNELDFLEYFFNNNIDVKNTVIFNLARNGTDFSKKSIIPAFSDLVNLNYTSSDSFTCSLSRNKLFFSNILNQYNLPAPEIIYSNFDGFFYDKKILHKNKKFIIKPISSAASIGIDNNNIGTYNDLKNNFNNYKDKIICQEYIDGCECEVPVIILNGNLIALEPILISSKDNQILTQEISNDFNYDLKLLKEIFPDNFFINNIKECAKKTFKLLNFKNYGRIDFRIDKKTKKFFITDISTTPYLNKHSSFGKAFKEAGLNYEDIFKIIINNSLNTNIL